MSRVPSNPSDSDSTLPAITVIVPGDPKQKTGGYGYVRRIVESLSKNGGAVTLMGLPGRFPMADETAEMALDQALDQLSESSLVVIDGLALGNLPRVAERHRHRLRLVALVHHPLADETGLSATARKQFADSERQALAAVEGVIVTSHFTARRLADWGVDQSRIRIVEPGVDSPPQSQDTHKKKRADKTPSTGKSLRLLCVGSITPRKGQDVLIKALARSGQRRWDCDLIGSLTRDAVFARQIRHQIDALGMTDSITILGELEKSELDQCYEAADLLVVPSWYEGYGMVVTEALAHGLPVLASSGGALAETVPAQAGLLVPPGDASQLADALEMLADDPDALLSLSRGAEAYRAQLRSWETAGCEFEAALVSLIRQTDTLMSREQTVFASDWLGARELHDHSARAADLTATLNTAIRNRQVVLNTGQLAVVDLGAGTGSNFRYLAPKLAVPQSWQLIDQDQRLLRQAFETPVNAVDDVAMSTCQMDIIDAPVNRWLPDSTSLVTASALLDLVTERWLRVLVNRMIERQTAGLFALSYDGQFSFSQPLAEDEWIRELVNTHQQGNKSTSTHGDQPYPRDDETSLGRRAVARLKTLLEAGGFQVTIRATPWSLGPGSEGLQRQLIAGWCEAACEKAPADRKAIESWQARRLHTIEQRGGAITVGHQDLLALPPQNQS